MNRGRRRGRPGLTGLRDGVKRRLFDPHLVPTKPDAKYEVSRLTPLNYVKPSVDSRLNQLRQSTTDEMSALSQQESSGPTDSLLQNLFTTKAKMEIAFRNSRFYHPLPPTIEGIDIQRVFKVAVNSDESNKTMTPLLSHLLLCHDHILNSDDGTLFSGLEDPDHWYPVELINFTKGGRKARRTRRKTTQEKRPVPEHTTDDLNDLVADNFIKQAIDNIDVVNDDAVDKPNATDVQEGKGDSDANSDDDRWNGEVRPADDEDDDEELDNDYCQTYFDNGEGDLSDELNGGDDDDDGGARYYD